MRAGDAPDDAKDSGKHAIYKYSSHTARRPAWALFVWPSLRRFSSVARIPALPPASFLSRPPPERNQPDHG